MTFNPVKLYRLYWMAIRFKLCRHRVFGIHCEPHGAGYTLTCRVCGAQEWVSNISKPARFWRLPASDPSNSEARHPFVTD